MSTNVIVTHKEGGYALFRLFRVASISFQPVLARSSLFWLVTTCSESFCDGFTEFFELRIYEKCISF